MGIIKDIAGLKGIIEFHKPPHAAAYMLQNSDHKSPSYGGHGLEPFAYDPELPSGDYHIFFLSGPTSSNALPYLSRKIVLPSLELVVVCVGRPLNLRLQPITYSAVACAKSRACRAAASA